jgi:prepilin-type processing-associated H-X9-DG protein/prepilin-type N-terminal cleavage/methylation domain-containing protein
MHKFNSNKKSNIAFTLVELLVVISIIGLLAGLAVPAINGGLKSAKAGACLSNLHQIGVATMAYAADNSFKLPPGGVDGENNWARDVYNYCGGSDTTKANKKTLFICPGCSKSVKTDVPAGQIPLTYSGHKGLMPSGSNTVVALSSVARPTEVILAGDGCQVSAGGFAGYVIDSPAIFSLQGGKGGSVVMETAISAAPDSDSGGGGGALRYRHAGKVNLVMCDGHAEAIKKGAVLNKHVVFGQ